MTITREQRSRSFDTVAELYATARPGYPSEAFNEIAQLVPPPARVLEVGCGPGTATIELARRGYRILAVELGGNLARVARERLAAYPRAQVIQADFHDWQPDAEAFDVFFAASSFQFVDPSVGYTKAAQVLSPNGLLALIWNHNVRGEGAAARFWDANQAIYRRLVPSIAAPVPASRRAGFDPRPDIRASRLFGIVRMRTWRWLKAFDTEAYRALLETYSDHITLPAGDRETLLDEIAALIDDRFGGTVKRAYRTTLYTARKR
jgi:SAM-dependent methyltransferase